MNFKTENELAGEKLLHYSRMKPKHFLSLEGYHCPNGGNELMRPDIDGDALLCSGIVELMDGGDVQILIPHDADIKVAVRQIKKLAKWLKADPLLFKLAQPKPKPEFEDDLPF